MPIFSPIFFTVSLLEVRPRILHALHRQADTTAGSHVPAPCTRLPALLQGPQAGFVGAKFPDRVAGAHSQHDDPSETGQFESCR